VKRILSLFNIFSTNSKIFFRLACLHVYYPNLYNVGNRERLPSPPTRPLVRIEVTNTSQRLHLPSQGGRIVLPVVALESFEASIRRLSQTVMVMKCLPCTQSNTTLESAEGLSPQFCIPMLRYPPRNYSRPSVPPTPVLSLPSCLQRYRRPPWDIPL